MSIVQLTEDCYGFIAPQFLDNEIYALLNIEDSEEYWRRLHYRVLTWVGAVNTLQDDQYMIRLTGLALKRLIEWENAGVVIGLLADQVEQYATDNVMLDMKDCPLIGDFVINDRLIQMVVEIEDDFIDDDSFEMADADAVVDMMAGDWDGVPMVMDEHGVQLNFDAVMQDIFDRANEEQEEEQPPLRLSGVDDPVEHDIMVLAVVPATVPSIEKKGTLKEDFEATMELKSTLEKQNNDFLELGIDCVDRFERAAVNAIYELVLAHPQVTA